jgi:hypothetical protein
MVGGGLVWNYKNNSKQKHKTQPRTFNLKLELKPIFWKKLVWFWFLWHLRIRSSSGFGLNIKMELEGWFPTQLL